MVQESLTEKLAQEHRPEGSLGVSHVVIVRWLQTDRSGSAKALRQKCGMSDWEGSGIPGTNRPLAFIPRAADHNGDVLGRGKYDLAAVLRQD